MTVDEAIEAYLRLATEGFRAPGASLIQSWWKKKTPLDGDSITKVIGDIVQKTLGDRHARLQEPCGSAGAGFRFCRTAVLAASSTNASDPPYIFRSYPSSHPASTYAIHEVARATVATAGIFPPISLGVPPIEFIDAGVAGYNNPAEIALQESGRIWPGAQIKCLVSLGTGLQSIARVSGTWQDVMDISRRLIEDCERVHHALDQKFPESPPYFRFNVDRGLDKVGVKEWDMTSGDMAAITAGYTRQPSIDRSLNLSANVLMGVTNG